ncbi:MAG: mandelate racemase/muconate lactonizing enzyme family protein [Dehalococcoidia bacterium]
MRITRLRAVQPDAPTTPPDWRRVFGQILVVLDTDTGVRGFGVGGGGEAGIQIVERFLQPLLIGSDAHEVEARWQEMYQATLPFGRSGLAIMAISGVDLALWDARGKAEAMSVAALLGGVHHPRVPCYATGADPAAAVARGFRAVKLPLARRGTTPEEAIELVARTRDGIGLDVALMTDAGMQWNLEQSLRATEGFAAHGVGWLEEPLPPDDLAGYAELSRRSPVAIAGGEHDYTAAGFRELAAHRALAIWQPDVTWAGGMTQLRAIYEMAAEEGIRVCPHRGAEVWGLHAIAALDPAPLAESGRPWITWLQGQSPIEDGFITLPDRPGFGVEPAADLLGL